MRDDSWPCRSVLAIAEPGFGSPHGARSEATRRRRPRGWIVAANPAFWRHEDCLWRTEAPASYEYLFRGDESFVVLEGSVSIELAETGERVDLKAGDIASFNNGTRSVWAFTEPFKKFTVISA
jgi:uncharacterized cupin superfamily protein